MPITRPTSGARSSALTKARPISPVEPVTATVSIGWILSGPVREARAAALPLDLALALGAGAALDVVPPVQHLLQPGDGLGRVGGELGCQLEGRVLGPGGRGNPVDEA